MAIWVGTIINVAINNEISRARLQSRHTPSYHVTYTHVAINGNN